MDRESGKERWTAARSVSTKRIALLPFVFLALGCNRPAAVPLQGNAGPSERSAPPSAPANERHAAAKTTERERPAPITVSAGPDFENMRAGMVNPSAEQPLPCDANLADARPCGRVRVLHGPFVLTNLYSMGGCSQELFAMSADSKLYWTMLAQPNDRINITGQFPVEEGQSLYIGARGNTPAKADMRCSVVWSGYRPQGRPSATSPYLRERGDGEN